MRRRRTLWAGRGNSQVGCTGEGSRVNDEFRMTNDESVTKHEGRMIFCQLMLFSHSKSKLIGHWSFHPASWKERLNACGQLSIGHEHLFTGGQPLYFHRRPFVAVK